jgi:hypothetical protein
MTECNVALDVSEVMRTAALAFPHTENNPIMIPDTVTCEIDKHRYGDHAALLLDLGSEHDGAAWVTWPSGASNAEVERKPYCPSNGPSRENTCWLFVDHRGGHSWERYE